MRPPTKTYIVHRVITTVKVLEREVTIPANCNSDEAEMQTAGIPSDDPGWVVHEHQPRINTDIAYRSR